MKYSEASWLDFQLYLAEVIACTAMEYGANLPEQALPWLIAGQRDACNLLRGMEN